MSDKVVTRFAPSPTGFLHIGGARTALFNWLYARSHGGKMLLRIEDTDRERSTQAAWDAIIEGLTWLGIDWDGEAVSQYARAERHRDIALQLVEQGAAYYCFATQEELAERPKAVRPAMTDAGATAIHRRLQPARKGLFASRPRRKAKRLLPTSCKATFASPIVISTISSSCARMVHPPICWPLW